MLKEIKWPKRELFSINYKLSFRSSYEKDPKVKYKKFNYKSVPELESMIDFLKKYYSILNGKVPKGESKVT